MQGNEVQARWLYWAAKFAALALGITLAFLVQDSRQLAFGLILFLPLASLPVSVLLLVIEACALGCLLLTGSFAPPALVAAAILAVTADGFIFKRLSILDDQQGGFLAGMRPWYALLLFAAALAFAAMALIRRFDPAASLCLAASMFLLAWRLRAPLRVDPFGLAMATVSTLLLLGLLEVASRQLMPMPPYPVNLYEPHPESIFMHRRGVEATLELPNTDFGESTSIPVRINSAGFRGPELESPKPANEIRILCLGDSYTFGQGALEESTFVAQLERLLQGVASGKAVRVINGGLAGQGPWQERITLNERGFALQPDLVVLQTFMANDVGDTLLEERRVLECYHDQWLEFVRAFEDESTLAYRLNRYLRTHLNLYLIAERRLLREWIILKAYREFRFLPEQRRWHVDPPIIRSPLSEPDLCDWYPALNEGWAKLQEDLRGIVQDCHARGIPVAGFNIPWNINYRRDLLLVKPDAPYCYEVDKGNKLMEEFLAGAVDTFVPMREVFRAHPEPKRLIFKSDGHFNADGGKFVASRLAEYLLPLLEDLGSGAGAGETNAR